MKITVTEEDIQQGARRHCNLCPVALAFDRALREKGIEFDLVYVGPLGRCRYERGEHWKDFSLPPQVQKFIEDFDHYREVKPFEFELNTNPIVRGPRLADDVYAT